MHIEPAFLEQKTGDLLRYFADLIAKGASLCGTIACGDADQEGPVAHSAYDLLAVFIAARQRLVPDSFERHGGGMAAGCVRRKILGWGGHRFHFDAQFEDTFGCFHLYSADDAEWLAGQIIDIQSTLEDVVQLVVA